MGKSLIKALIVSAVFGALLSSWQVFVACWIVGWTMVWLTHNDDSSPETSDGNAKEKRQKIVPQYVLLQRLERLEQELAVKRFAREEGQQPETVARAADDEFELDLPTPMVFRQPENIVSNVEDLTSSTYTNSSHPNPPPQAGEGTGFRQPETLGIAESSSRKKVVLKRRPQTTDHADAGAAWEDNPLFAWFMRANPLLKIGALVLFLGLAFLLRYVGGAIPLVGRYALVFVAGAGAVGGGRSCARISVNMV